uniref:Mitochondrial ribonuclease P protein 1 n=1 Tax=Panagrellus redivivus TaxID=6233 RepID=A0A7E4ULS9_PANRE
MDPPTDQHRLIIIDALDIMHHAQTVINNLYPKDDKTPDALYLPILANELLSKGGNVRIFINSYDYVNRQNYRNFVILERLRLMGLLHIVSGDPVVFRSTLLQTAKKHAALIVSRDSFHNIFPDQLADVPRHVRLYEVTTDPDFKKEDLLERLVVQSKVSVNFLPHDELVIPVTHREYAKICLGAVNIPMFNHANSLELETLLELIRYNLSYELLKKCPTFNEEDYPIIPE